MSTNKLDAALKDIEKAQAALDKTLETHLTVLREEKKNHEDKAKEIGKIIEKLTGKSDVGSNGGGSRKKWDDTILALLKSGAKDIKAINSACEGKNQYQKLETMVKAGTVTKEGDRTSGGVTYKLAK